jgi:hypothetical protein
VTVTSIHLGLRGRELEKMHVVHVVMENLLMMFYVVTLQVHILRVVKIVVATL